MRQGQETNLLLNAKVGRMLKYFARSIFDSFIIVFGAHVAQSAQSWQVLLAACFFMLAGIRLSESVWRSYETRASAKKSG